ncbi:MAG TPA: hypothetical protein VFH88_04585, partial [Candidatus Krumholzibacteria bacterium]|nr:hypothetical protein [Candidatus Krumholzibacteria bacterium]
MKTGRAKCLVWGAAIALVVGPGSAAAQEEDVSEHVSVELDAGFAGKYDVADYWGSGYNVGVRGLWAVNTTTSVCARFGIEHWPYQSAPVIPTLVPPGAVVSVEKSTGQVEKLSLTPAVRYQRENVVSLLGAFLEAGVGIAYVKTFALTEVLYFGGLDDYARFEIDESTVRAQVSLAAGLTRAISTSSWLELLSAYELLLMDGTPDVFSISVGFRV